MDNVSKGRKALVLSIYDSSLKNEKEFESRKNYPGEGATARLRRSQLNLRRLLFFHLGKEDLHRPHWQAYGQSRLHPGVELRIARRCRQQSNSASTINMLCSAGAPKISTTPETY